MLSSPCGSFGYFAPDQVLRITEEYCGPNCIRPQFSFSFDPSYNLNQTPAVASISTRVSEVQLARAPGRNPPPGPVSVTQPVLLKNGDP